MNHISFKATFKKRFRPLETIIALLSQKSARHPEFVFGAWNRVDTWTPRSGLRWQRRVWCVLSCPQLSTVTLTYLQPINLRS